MPPRLPGSRLDLERTHPLRAWAGRVRETHPELHNLFSAIVDTMAAYPDCPAAPVRTGHGGRTLFEHSLVVVEQIVVVARTFQFDGGRSKDGRLVAPILDPQFQFDPDDPLIVLLAFAHDLGKLECYRRDAATGRIEELHRDHDRIGRLMLARMPELWALENPDRQVLLYAVGYYHRPQDMPKYVDDRARALMELLIVADNAAGKYETAHPVWARAPAPALGTALVAAAEPPDDLSQASAPERLAPTTTERPETELDSWEASLVEAFLSVIALPQAINGHVKQVLAYRWDDLLYFEEHRLRAAIARELHDDALRRTKKGDGRFQVTEDLMRALLKLGVLYREHEGLTFSEKRAIYRVNWLMGRNDETGTRVYDRVDEKYTSEATIIVKVEGPVAARVPAGNCRLKPRIVGPLYGKSSAINKNAPPANAGTAAETPPIDVDDSDEGDGEVLGAFSEESSESALADIAQVDDPVAPSVGAAPATVSGDAVGASLLALVDAARALESPPELSEPAGQQSSAPLALPVKPIETAELRARIDLVDGPAGVIAFDGHAYRGRAIPLDRATAYADLIAALEADVTGECRVVREPDCILLMIRDHEKAKNVRRTDIGVAA